MIIVAGLKIEVQHLRSLKCCDGKVKLKVSNTIGRDDWILTSDPACTKI
jgi:hypothetical protein